MKTETGIIVAAAMLALVGSVLIVPPASAHTCASYYGCDPHTCKDGEEHDHTQYNYVRRDEHCESHAAKPADPTQGPPPPGWCTVLVVPNVPPSVCKLLGNSTDLQRIMSTPDGVTDCGGAGGKSSSFAGPIVSFALTVEPSDVCRGGASSQFAPMTRARNVEPDRPAGAASIWLGGHVAEARLDSPA